MLLNNSTGSRFYSSLHLLLLLLPFNYFSNWGWFHSTKYYFGFIPSDTKSASLIAYYYISIALDLLMNLSKAFFNYLVPQSGCWNFISECQNGWNFKMMASKKHPTVETVEAFFFLLLDPVHSRRRRHNYYSIESSIESSIKYSLKEKSK